MKDEKNFGVNVLLEYISWDDLTLYLNDKKKPLITIVDTSFLSYHNMKAAHAVVIVGYEKEKVIINDPWFEEKEKITNIDEFKLAWGKFDNMVIKIFKI